ncbi:MAG: hypothetical protein HYT76_08240 [Deltaproteobacteria bacterium]|nr:hypothetical protein [Deltaproteobacteria bacterium]
MKIPPPNSGFLRRVVAEVAETVVSEVLQPHSPSLAPPPFSPRFPAFPPDWTRIINLRKLVAIFREIFFKSYERGNCSTNIINFLKAAEERGMDISGAEVVFIMARGNASQKKALLRPLCPRNATSGWSAHVVLRDGRVIFDLDFTDSPRVVGVHDYFRRMFGYPDPEAIASVSIRTVPATEFLAENRALDFGVFYTIDDFAEEFYPKRSLVSYLHSLTAG